MGVGEAVADRKVMDAAVGDMTKITGQKPLICKSRKSIASFKLREGLAIGCKVTLRGERMYEFLDRLISVAMPRIRDFRACQRERSMAGATTPWASKSRLFSPKSSTTRSTRSGAWTSQSRRQLPTINRVGRCSRLSTSRSGSKRFQKAMAKTNMVERDKRRAKIVKKYAVRRAELKELIRSPKTAHEDRLAAQGAAAGVAAGCESVAPAQSLCDHGRSRGVYRKFGLARVKIVKSPIAARSPA